ncbi:MAG: protein rep [Gemmatimonadales bacterium]|nr:protein rep [Gemmatimonadales bacterium]NIQ99192.1 protein rep [Gemmatimonadales bacterium]
MPDALPAVVGTLPASCYDQEPEESDPTSLDSAETESQPTRCASAFDHIGRQPATVSFRHSGWARTRRAVYDSLRRTCQPPHRQYEFLHCGAHAYVVKSTDDPPRYKLAGSSCHDRFCLPCANERSRAIALNVADATKGKTLRFLTLTVRSQRESLANRLDHLYNSFQKLRRRRFWTKRVTGGMAFLEVKWSSVSQRWHPHFHVLVEGRYLPYAELRKYWYAVTADSHVIDIRLIRDHRKCTQYVTKYCSKPLNKTFTRLPEQLDECVEALKGRKLVVTFGDWRGLVVARKLDGEKWEYVDSLQHLFERAAHQDAEALAILRALTDAPLTPFLIRAPPEPKPATAPVPNQKQQTLFGTWERNGTFRLPE